MVTNEEEKGDKICGFYVESKKIRFDV